MWAWSRFPTTAWIVWPEMFNPKKLVHASIEYVDTPGSVIQLARTGTQSQALREMDALIHVVRAFEDPAIPAEGGTVDARRDIESVELELALSDLAVVEKRLERLEKDIRKQKNPALEKEQQALLKAKQALEAEQPLRELDFTADEEHTLRGFTFLSLKPMLYRAEPGRKRCAARQRRRGICPASRVEAAPAHGRDRRLRQD